MVICTVELPSCLAEMAFQVGKLAFCRVEMVIQAGWMALAGGKTPIQVVGRSIQPVPMALNSQIPLMDANFTVSSALIRAICG
jgi:hypothetical protein